MTKHVVILKLLLLLSSSSLHVMFFFYRDEAGEVGVSDRRWRKRGKANGSRASIGGSSGGGETLGRGRNAFRLPEFWNATASSDFYFFKKKNKLISLKK